MFVGLKVRSWVELNLEEIRCVYTVLLCLKENAFMHMHVRLKQQHLTVLAYDHNTVQ